VNKSVIRCGCGKEFAPPPLSLRALAGGAGITCREEGGAPSLGRLSSLDPPTILTQFSSCFSSSGLGGGLGSGEEGCLGEGCLCDRDPDSRGWVTPTTNSSLQVIPMETKSSKGSVKPGAPPRVRPRGSWGTGGLKPEPGRLSLARLGPDGKRGGELSNGSNVSNASSARRLLLPSGEVIDVPEGLSAKVDKRGNVVYRVEGREVVVRLVGELLFRVSRGYRGSVACFDDRRMASLLGLSGYLDAFSSSWVRGVLVLLGFEEVRRGKSNKAIVIDVRKPIMNEVKNAKSINEVVEIIKRHLRW